MEALDIDRLPDDPKALKALLKSQQDELRERELEYQKLRLELAKLEEERRLDRARRFGASSEAGDHQYRLFDEAEQSEEAQAPTVDTEPVAATAHKRRPKRKPLPVDLPRVVIEHDLPQGERQCGCGCAMVVMGEKTSEQLDVIPAQVYVIEHRRKAYSCPQCDESIQTAPLPPQPIAKSVASPGLLAHVATAKYADGLPLYRQSKQFQRLGVELPRNTLANHMVKAGALIQPLMDRLHQHVLAHDVLQMDETPVQVLKEPGKVARSQSYMWVIKGGPPHQPAVLYRYDPSRSKAVPQQLLTGYTGYLQTDGYAGYNAILQDPGTTGVGCWAHVRRKFMEAKKALPPKEQNKATKVHQALAYIGQLYQLERRIAEVSAEERRQQRQQHAQPILDRFAAWLAKTQAPPKTLLGKAITYTQSQWPRLQTYVDDDRLSIDNNGVENAIRPFALGRKNWLFSDSQGGAKASAALYSLIETAKANGLNDYAYLKHVFTNLPAAASAEEIDALMPWNIDTAELSQYLNKLA